MVVNTGTNNKVLDKVARNNDVIALNEKYILSPTWLREHYQKLKRGGGHVRTRR